MLILRGSQVAALGACLAVLTLLGSPADASALTPRARLPSALLALEQKMKALRVNTERGTIVESLGGVGFGSAGGLLEAAEGKQAQSEGKVATAIDPTVRLPLAPPMSIPLLTIDFEASVSPRLAIIRGEFLGGISLQLRLIGEQEYERSPFLGLLVSGKPWVYVSPAERAKERASNTTEGASPVSVTGEPEAGFAKLIAWLAKARSVVDMGPAVVDRQPTTEFRATLDLEKTLSAANGGSSKAGRRKRLVHEHETLYLFLASDGLPVRTHEQVRIGTGRLDLTTDILATEVPVSVTPPPASETISQAELEKQEKEAGPGLTHLSKREREEARRFGACMDKHFSKHAKHVSKREFNKVVHECERISKQPQSKQ
ncbi:MAG: hypothetical protein WAU69_09780 [Solirubrobacteraceae bacterium]